MLPIIVALIVVILAVQRSYGQKLMIGKKGQWFEDMQMPEARKRIEAAERAQGRRP